MFPGLSHKNWNRNEMCSSGMYQILILKKFYCETTLQPKKLYFLLKWILFISLNNKSQELSLWYFYFLKETKQQQAASWLVINALDWCESKWYLYKKTMFLCLVKKIILTQRENQKSYEFISKSDTSKHLLFCFCWYLII